MERVIKPIKLNKSECEAFAKQIKNTIDRIVNKEYDKLLNGTKVTKAIKAIEQEDDYKELYKLETERIETLKLLKPILDRNNISDYFNYDYKLCDKYKDNKKEQILKDMNVEKIYPYEKSNSINTFVTLSLFTNLDIPKFEQIAQDIINNKIEINKY